MENQIKDDESFHKHLQSGSGAKNTENFDIVNWKPQWNGFSVQCAPFGRYLRPLYGSK